MLQNRDAVTDRRLSVVYYSLGDRSLIGQAAAGRPVNEDAQEDRLARANELWIRAAAAWPDPVWIVDANLQLAEYNDAFAAIYAAALGHPPGVGDNVLAALQDRPLQSGESWEEAFRRALSGEACSFLALTNDVDLGQAEYWIWLRPLLAADGQSEDCCLCVSENYTQRFLRESAWRRSADQLRSLIDSAPDAIAILDMDLGRFIDANSAAEQLFNLPREELLRTNPWQESPERQPDGRLSAEAAKAYIEGALAGNPQQFEWVHLNRKGESIDLEIHLAHLPDPSRRLVRGNLRDISERKAAERRDARHLEMLRELISRLPDSAVVRRIETGGDRAEYIFLGGALERLTGYSTAELAAGGLEALMAPADLARHKERREHARRSGSLLESIVRLRKRDGEYLTISIQARAWRGRGGEVIWDAILRDLTAAQAAEQELLRTERQGSQALLVDQERERKGIAARLQEGAAQSVSAASYTLDAALEMIRLGRLPEGMQLAEQIRQQLGAAVRDLQQLTQDLTPTELHDFGLYEAIESFVRAARRRLRVGIRFYSQIGGARFDEEIELAAYRIAADFVDSGASNMQLRLSWRGRELRLLLCWRYAGPPDSQISEKILSAGQRRAELAGGRLRRHKAEGALQACLALLPAQPRRNQLA
ncbi:MAG: PAS domain S-box protein [Leptospirales bacterium]|nr:PAS domain S-box protein [Leptospirales bacterium]